MKPSPARNMSLARSMLQQNPMSEPGLHISFEKKLLAEVLKWRFSMIFTLEMFEVLVLVSWSS